MRKMSLVTTSAFALSAALAFILSGCAISQSEPEDEDGNEEEHEDDTESESETEGSDDNSCGNGVVEPPELCDDGVNDNGYGGCSPNCMGFGPHCGDAIANGLLADGGLIEACDDGDTDPTDECVDCEAATCGDDHVWSGVEACDDGVNDDSYGGCAPGCLELGPYCGDGEVYDGLAPDGGVLEECDDGDTDNTDECTEGCLDAVCGDGYVWEGEEACDDGTNEGGYAGCEPGCGALGPHCGDSEINGPEICDDGVNDDSYGGCAPGCLELGPYCGDGEVYDGPGLDGGVLEECDDGDGEIGDGCTAECVEEYCGDDLVGWSRPKDGFEEGLTILPWETGTAVGMDGPFEVWGAGAMIPHSGDHMLASASPASFASDTRAYVQVTMDIVGDSLACFWYAGDKPFFSTFRFSVDGDEELVLNGLSADVPWTKLCVDVPAGDDTVFLWEYEQHWFEEGSVFYIDDVVLPLIQEECDDGNAASLDGCSAVCLSE